MNERIFERTMALTDALIKKVWGKNPKITSACMCGSSKFCDLIAVVKWEFEKKGILSTGLNFLPQWYMDHKKFEEPHHLAEQEQVADILDTLHEIKIDNSDCIVVINPGNYIGERTAIEIQYAMDQGKPVYYWEKQ